MLNSMLNLVGLVWETTCSQFRVPKLGHGFGYVPSSPPDIYLQRWDLPSVWVFPALAGLACMHYCPAPAKPAAVKDGRGANTFTLITTHRLHHLLSLYIVTQPGCSIYIHRLFLAHLFVFKLSGKRLEFRTHPALRRFLRSCHSWTSHHCVSWLLVGVVVAIVPKGCGF